MQTQTIPQERRRTTVRTNAHGTFTVDIFRINAHDMWIRLATRRARTINHVEQIESQWSARRHGRIQYGS
jgi:hypothetical protein